MTQLFAFQGLSRFSARWAILGQLKRLDLFRGQREHPMKIPVCSRSGKWNPKCFSVLFCVSLRLGIHSAIWVIHLRVQTIYAYAADCHPLNYLCAYRHVAPVSNPTKHNICASLFSILI